jgi:type II secretory pathway pseudopilin PulG
MKTGLAVPRIFQGRTSRRHAVVSLNPPKALAAGTLVEVIIATCILAIMAAAIISAINYGMFAMRLARENARATQIMLENLESIRLYNWDEVNQVGYVPQNFTNVYDPQGQIGNQGPTYFGTMTVSNVGFSTTYNTNMKQFTVTLQWNTFGRVNHSRQLSTYVARDGLQNYVY